MGAPCQQNWHRAGCRADLPLSLLLPDPLQPSLLSVRCQWVACVWRGTGSHGIHPDLCQALLPGNRSLLDGGCALLFPQGSSPAGNILRCPVVSLSPGCQMKDSKLKFLDSICTLCRSATDCGSLLGLEFFCRRYELAEKIKVRVHLRKRVQGTPAPWGSAWAGRGVGGTECQVPAQLCLPGAAERGAPEADVHRGAAAGHAGHHWTEVPVCPSQCPPAQGPETLLLRRMRDLSLQSVALLIVKTSTER